MVALLGFASSVGGSARLVLDERVVQLGGVGDVNSLVCWPVRTSWKGFGVCAGRGAALDVRCRGSGGKGSSGYTYARDRVVDFGKNKGSMLGTLSSR